MLLQSGGEGGNKTQQNEFIPKIVLLNRMRGFLAQTGYRPRLGSAPWRPVGGTTRPSIIAVICLLPPPPPSVCLQTQDKTHSRVIKPVKNGAEGVDTPQFRSDTFKM